MSNNTNPDFDAILASATDPIKAIAHAARALIFEVLPQTVEVVWVNQKLAGYGTGPKKMTEHFSWIGPYKQHVVLGFNYGSELPDPDGLLEGTGALMRHIKLKTLADVERPAVRQLLAVAITHRVPPPKPHEG